MALLDFLKKKEDVEKAKKSAPKKTEKVSVKKEIKKEETTKAPVVEQASTKSKGFSYDMVREPHISEKATYLAEKNKYTFKVHARANKPEIKKSVEGIYGVNVLDVNIIKAPAKKRRLGRTEGFRKGFAKAVVTIKEGQKIEIF